MATNKSRMVLKTALLAPVGPIEAWGVQQLLSGDPVAGVTAMVIGALFVGAFVAFQEYDLPYESEIVDLIEQNRDAMDEDDAKQLAKDVSELYDQAGKPDVYLNDGESGDSSDSNNDSGK